MSIFEYVMVLLSVVLSLALIQPLTSVGCATGDSISRRSSPMILPGSS